MIIPLLWPWPDSPKYEPNRLAEANSRSIQNIAKLINELGLENIHQQFYSFCYLLWNGYFSVDKKYVFSNKDILDEDNTIFLGKGCCRHNSSLLKNVLNLTLEKELVKELDMRIIHHKLKRIMDIEYEIENYQENHFISINIPNHTATLVHENEGFIILDPTMLTEFEIIKGANLVCFNGKFIINPILLRKMLKKLNYKEYQSPKTPTLTKNILLDNYEIAKVVCKKNSALFDDFFTENQSNYEEVKKLVLERKQTPRINGN